MCEKIFVLDSSFGTLATYFKRRHDMGILSTMVTVDYLAHKVVHGG